MQHLTNLTVIGLKPSYYWHSVHLSSTKIGKEFMPLSGLGKLTCKVDFFKLINKTLVSVKRQPLSKLFFYLLKLWHFFLQENKKNKRRKKHTSAKLSYFSERSDKVLKRNLTVFLTNFIATRCENLTKDETAFQQTIFFSMNTYYRCNEGQ